MKLGAVGVQLHHYGTAQYGPKLKESIDELLALRAPYNFTVKCFMPEYGIHSDFFLQKIFITEKIKFIWYRSLD